VHNPISNKNNSLSFMIVRRQKPTKYMEANPITKNKKTNPRTNLLILSSHHQITTITSHCASFDSPLEAHDEPL
jgi:hypothetical protein